jgi:hypothetical protein
VGPAHRSTVPPNASYTLQNSDVNDTIEVIVTGHNANVGADGMASATSAATGTVLANDLQPLAQTDVPDGTVEATAPSTNRHGVRRR